MTSLRMFRVTRGGKSRSSGGCHYCNATFSFMCFHHIIGEITRITVEAFCVRTAMILLVFQTKAMHESQTYLVKSTSLCSHAISQLSCDVFAETTENLGFTVVHAKMV